ncbi:MAG: TatD family hydrolase [Candidatus Izemoplasmataceae bacterium]
MLIDTHVHLNNPALEEDLDYYVNKALEADVKKMMVIGFTPDTNKKAIRIAEKYPFISASIGLHPTIAKDVTAEMLDRLEALLMHPEVHAVGECGMDLYWDGTYKDRQIEIFEHQIRLSKSYDLPIVVHMRDADELTYEILRKHAPLKGVMHSFSGSAEMAQKFLDLGLHISLGGPVTFTNAKKPKEVAKGVPIEKLLLETDAPFLTPHPYRGKQNDSSFIPLIAKKIAELKGLSFDEVAQKTSENATRLFNLKG